MWSLPCRSAKSRWMRKRFCRKWGLRTEKTISRPSFRAGNSSALPLRALAKNPKLLLCDEPTGALDYVTGKAVLKLLQDTCRERGMTVIIITHNSALTPMADRVIRVHNGKASSCEVNAHPVFVEQIEW